MLESAELFGVSMKLVICEKNIAARRIAQILAKGDVKRSRLSGVPLYVFTYESETWNVIGLKGHIITLDYPKQYNQWKQTPPQQLISIEPVKKVSERAIATALKTLAQKKPDVIIATDYDREGELIGFEAIQLLEKYLPEKSSVKRAKFSALTASEVTEAFANLKKVDYNLASSGESRQIIDLVWGAVLTRFISLTSNQLGKDFLSIGRVQSPTLALLVDREKEIMNFVPKKYWEILADLKQQKAFTVKHEHGRFWEEDPARAIYDKIKDSTEATVAEVTKTTNNERPPSPFSTTTFLQAASGLGFSASRAMSTAEDLYMSGLISYPRTDNTVYPRSLNVQSILKKLTQSSVAKEAQLVLENRRRVPTRGRTQTTDHPPIHPVNVPSAKLTSEQLKIYELICRRFLATFAQDAISESMEVSLRIKDEPFVTSGYRLIEAHWRSIYPYFKEKRKPLPDMQKHEKIPVTRINLNADKTKPPKRYSQGALIAKMEELQLGTKSTRHEIISKLYSRRYIVGSPPRPTATAIAVIDALEHCNVTKPDMTAELEEDMNKIAEGNKKLEETVKESRGMLTQVMTGLVKDKEAIKSSIRDALKEQRHMGICPKCGHDLTIRTSRKRKRFVGCTNYPKCTNTYPLPQRGAIVKTDKTCEHCGAPLVVSRMKGRKKWEFCLNPDCPSKKKNEQTK